MEQGLIIFVTTSNHEEATRIAETVVAERLAACVSLLPAIESVYRWEGRVNKDREVLLLIKTTEGRYPELESRILQLHSYTTPEMIAVKVERGLTAYLDWLASSVSGADA